MLKLIRVLFFAGVCLGGFVLPALAGNNSSQAFSTWPDTGQTKCYNDTVEIPCPAVGQPFYGQDAQYSGPSRSYTDMGSGMIQDNVTGLVWEQKTNMDGVAEYADPHDADNIYTWCDPNPETNGGDAGTCSGNDTQGFINQLNSANYGDHNDWRLPTIKELKTIGDRGRYLPAIDPVFAATTQSFHYWSSTTDTGLYFAWSVGFGSGYALHSDKSVSLCARAVRGGQTPPIENRFVDNGDTVTDTITGLEWQKVTIGSMSWKEALAATNNLTLNGKSDWRLPNQNELSSLIDYSRFHPAIDPVFTDSTQLSSYWSSSTLANYTYLAWLVDFNDGNDYHYDKSSNYYVRAVRGGQSGALGYLTPQVRPSDPVIPPEINGSGRKAVVLTHGWNSNVQAWATGMANQICSQIGGTVSGDGEKIGYAGQLTRYCSSSEWDIFVYDWSYDSITFAPWSAWANSVEHGTNLGKMLAKKDYAHVHLLAHSAGSMLIDSAKNWLRGMPKKPYIHLTFFDAYDPFAQIKDGKTLSAYGEGADWVDNYVDMRSLDTLFVSIMDGTKLLMPSAYNIDVTKWDARDQPLPPAAAIFRHEWPFVFYGESTFSPMTYDLGYQLSQEAGKTFPNPARKKKTVCTLPKQIVGTTPLACESTITVPNLETNTDKIHTIGDAYAVIQQVTNSVTGVINLIKNPVTGLIQYWGFSTGSPVWSKMDLDIKEPVNALTFDYEFLSAAGAEGYLTVFVDDNVVGHIDERKVISSGIHASDRMYIGELIPGAHTLVVRVDPYTNVQSSVKLSNLKLVYVNKEAKFPWNMFLPAITHKVK